MPTGIPRKNTGVRLDPFGRAIRKARLTAGFTQKMLAEVLGVSSAYVSGFETGNWVPAIEYIEEAAGVLHFDFEDLMNLAEKRRSTERVIRGSNNGTVYAVQLLPKLQPGRMKIGFSANAAYRLTSFRHICPEAKLLKTWPAIRPNETRLIKHLRQSRKCQQLAKEVFLFESATKALRTINDFFRRELQKAHIVRKSRKS